MTQIEFNKVKQELLEKADGIAGAKRKDYAKEYDVLDNFKLVADLCNLPPESGALTAWMVYFAKHVISIGKYTSGQELASESIKERFADAKNYIDLGYALVVERERDLPAIEPEIIEPDVEEKPLNLSEAIKKYAEKIFAPPAN
jgi:hypothetical protein